MLTVNEKKVLRLLIAAFSRDYSINQIARECGLAPNGALKILNKFEKEGILAIKRIANLNSYRLNFENEKTKLILELALIDAMEGRIKNRLDDLKGLKEAAKVCILFGSYTDLNKKPHDLDVLFVIDDYKKYKRKLASIIVPAKIHDVIQTKQDLKDNIAKGDEVVLSIIRKGTVLWGHKFIVEVIHDVYPGKA